MFLNLLALVIATHLPEVEMSEAQKLTLAQEATKAALNAYAPYSNYPVGAALLTKDGEIFRGANIENSSYGLCCCAERTAIFSAVAQGKKEMIAMAVSTRDGGTPCGACRQVMNEFNPQMLVIISTDRGGILSEERLNELLPKAFGPQNLFR